MDGPGGSQDLRRRGATQIDLIGTSGHDGLLAAVSELFWATPRQHCLVHRPRSRTSAQMDGIDLTSCNLRGCNLSGCQAAEALFAFADLQGANLSRTTLRSAYFAGADLSNAILTGAILKGAYMGAADLTGGNLSGADLSEADFINTNLNRAILTGADLSRTDFLQASLQGTDFSSCLLGGLTVFGDVDLSEARGLDRIKADGGPVILDIRSIYWSQGRIPEQFLRAACLPKSFLTLIPTLHFEEEDSDAQSNETEPTEEDRKLQAP